MSERKLGDANVTAIGLGCMNLSHAYGIPPEREAGKRLLNEALDLGYTHLDTAALYGFGANEELLAEAIAHRRNEYFLASKCGMFKNAEGKRTIDGRPETLKQTCEDGLKRLKTDVIDLYYLHRWDKNVPIEDSVGALSRLVEEGKIKAIGLSEVSADTLRKAHAVHPISAVQTEYSLWTRNPEIAVLEACKELGTTFVAFSPLARGYLGGILTDVETFAEKDIRRNMPRFSPENYAQNLTLLATLKTTAEKYNVSMAEVALAWILHQGDHIVAIPGTTNSLHLKNNLRAAELKLDAADIQALTDVFTPESIVGGRYNEATQAEIDTEEFA
jgi:aryl-alcohol dehydrogenase-like predicted oxidoreductase